MNREQIISALNEEIASLTSARDLLITNNPVAARGPEHPKGSTNNTPSAHPKKGAPKARRTVSAEGKARIAEAQRKRWAAANKPTKAKSVPTKQSSTAKKVVSPQKTAPPATTTSRKSVAKKAPAKKSAPPAAPTITDAGAE